MKREVIVRHDNAFTFLVWRVLLLGVFIAVVLAVLPFVLVASLVGIAGLVVMTIVGKR